MNERRTDADPVAEGILPDAPDAEEFEEREVEALARPSLWRQALPLIAVLGILYWVFQGVDFAAVKDAVVEADMLVFVPAALLFIVGYLVADVGGFGLAYTWFNAPVTLGEKLMIRGGALPLQVITPPLALVGVLLYMWRLHHVRPLQVVSSHMFVMICDTVNFTVMLSATLLLVEAELSAGWAIVCALSVLVLIVYFGYWFSDMRNHLFPSFEREGILYSIARARPMGYVRMSAIRSLFLLGNVVGSLIAFRAFGIDAPLGIAVVALVIMLAVTFLPISVGGFGGPQAAAVYFLGDHASEEVILAYSLLWSTAFLIGRLGFGLIFFRPLWKEILGAAPKKPVAETAST